MTWHKHAGPVCCMLINPFHTYYWLLVKNRHVHSSGYSTVAAEECKSGVMDEGP